jgi:diadenosine tetraphosphatase ApaH/serine/threonine PP2A family protein phosphatase
MPLVALISDIHGNLDALEAVLSDIKEAKADEILCLGDIVGYGAAPADCVALVRERCTATVKGNHEALLDEKSDLPLYGERVAAAIRHARATLSAPQKKWLKKLPFVVTIHGFTMVHASLEIPQEFGYLDNDDEARLHFKHQTTAICFNAHTHVPRIALDDEKSIGWGWPDANSPIQLRESHRCVINVGSVGQPRDDDPRACYVLFQTETLRFCFRRIAYDIQKAQERIREAALPWENASRLTKGE